jgi:hypothetical protein
MSLRDSVSCLYCSVANFAWAVYKESDTVRKAWRGDVWDLMCITRTTVALNNETLLLLENGRIAISVSVSLRSGV